MLYKGPSSFQLTPAPSTPGGNLKPLLRTPRLSSQHVPHLRNLSHYSFPSKLTHRLRSSLRDKSDSYLCSPTPLTAVSLSLQTERWPPLKMDISDIIQVMPLSAAAPACSEIQLLVLSLCACIFKLSHILIYLKNLVRLEVMALIHDCKRSDEFSYLVMPGADYTICFMQWVVVICKTTMGVGTQ